MLPASTVREVVVEELPATTQLLGFLFVGVGGGADAFELQVPVVGTVDVLEVGWSLPDAGGVDFQHELQIGVARTLPSSTGEMNGLPQLFPNSVLPLVAGEGSWFVTGASQVGPFRGRYRMRMDGAGFACRWTNGNSLAAAAYVWVIFESIVVVGEQEALRRPGKRRRVGDLRE